MTLARYARIMVFGLVCASAFENAALAQIFGHGKLSNSEGNWQLTPPTTAGLKTLYANGRGNGRLLLSTFPASAGNIVGVVPPTLNIEYQPSPRQIRLYVSDSDFFVIPIDSHGRGQAEVDTRSEVVSGYACTQTTRLSVVIDFKSDTSMDFVVLQRIEFVSSSGTGNCTDYLATVKAQLEAGTAAQPWIAFAASAGLKIRNWKHSAKLI